jgi:hypothetical protein
MSLNYTWEDNCGTETKIECFIGERKLPIWKVKPEQRQFLILFFANLAIETTSSGISYQRRDIHSICMFARMLLCINGKFTVKQI